MEEGGKRMKEEGGRDANNAFDALVHEADVGLIGLHALVGQIGHEIDGNALQPHIRLHNTHTKKRKRKCIDFDFGKWKEKRRNR